MLLPLWRVISGMLLWIIWATRKQAWGQVFGQCSLVHLPSLFISFVFLFFLSLSLYLPHTHLPFTFLVSLWTAPPPPVDEACQKRSEWLTSGGQTLTWSTQTWRGILGVHQRWGLHTEKDTQTDSYKYVLALCCCLLLTAILVPRTQHSSYWNDDLI